LADFCGEGLPLPLMKKNEVVPSLALVGSSSSSSAGKMNNFTSISLALSLSTSSRRRCFHRHVCARAKEMCVK
jgi:hypothetical protein